LHKLKFILSILLLISCSLSNAQHYYSENITSKNGLPNNAIRSLFQDSRGFMWIGTDAGVSRWDGETFINYNTLDGLAGNKVWWIDEDNKGNLWFACFGAGISKFDGLNFTSYSSSDGLVDNTVRVVKYSPHFDCLLIGTNKSISVLKDTIFHNFSAANGSLDGDVIITAIMEDKNQAVFYDFANHHYSLKINGEGRYILNKLKNNWLLNYGICSSAISNDGDTIIGWGREGIVIKKNDSGIEIPAIGQVFGIAEDNTGSLWAASWNGGGISPPGGLFKLEESNAIPLNETYNFESIRGWSVFFEKNKNLIFYGTLDNGIYKIPPQYFEYYPASFFNENKMNVTDMALDNKSNRWFVTGRQLIMWDGKNFQKLDIDSFYTVKQEFDNKARSLYNSIDWNVGLDEIRSNIQAHVEYIEIDNQGDAWVAINNLGLFQIPQNDLSNIKYYDAFIKLPLVPNIVFDEADSLFASDGYYPFLRKYSNIRKSNTYFDYEDSLHPLHSKNLFSYQNEIWACSHTHGVFLQKDGAFRTLTTEDPTINKIVNDICFDKQGNAYLAGNDGRIEVLDNKTRKKIFEINPSTHNSPVLWIEISNNMLLAGYGDGMKVFKLEYLNNRIFHARYFTFSEGYPQQLITGSEIDKNGDIWLTTSDGLVKINTRLLDEYESKPLLTVIEKVELQNEKTEWSRFAKINPWSGLPLQSIKLDPDQNHLSIYFHTLNFNNPEADLHYYKLDGIDADWNRSTSKNYVIYPYLVPGKYTFRVKSRNKLSGLFSIPAEFSFVILKPWYKQTWFIVLIIVLFAGIVISIYKIKVNDIKKNEKKKREILKKISELESKALQAQMNPHFLFNSMSSIQDYVLDHNIDQALTYLSSFSKIIRMTLEFVDRKFVKISEILTYLEHYVKLENMRFDDLFEYQVICDKEINPETTQIPPMILQTIIENAIAHGIRPLKQRGKITLQFIKINKETFKCIVEDNGIGREKSAQINKDQNLIKESRGLKIIRDRLELLNNGQPGPFKMQIIDLHSATGQATGTRVEITMAFSY